MRTVKLTAPSHWASYLFYDDSSGLDDAEVYACDLWLRLEGLSDPVDCEDFGFSSRHDAWDAYPYGADCQSYTFLVEEVR